MEKLIKINENLYVNIDHIVRVYAFEDGDSFGAIELSNGKSVNLDENKLKELKTVLSKLIIR